MHSFGNAVSFRKFTIITKSIVYSNAWETVMMALLLKLFWKSCLLRLNQQSKWWESLTKAQCEALNSIISPALCKGNSFAHSIRPSLPGFATIPEQKLPKTVLRGPRVSPWRECCSLWDSELWCTLRQEGMGCLSLEYHLFWAATYILMNS